MNASFRGRAIGLAIMIAACSPTPASPTPPSISTPASPTPHATTTPTVSPTGTPLSIEELTGRIVFARAGGRYGDETAFWVDADGTDEREIAGEVGGPMRLSPDGRLLLANGAFSEGGPVNGAVIDAARGVPMPLPDLHPTLNLAPQAWSPDGEWILYEGWDDTYPIRNGVYKARYPSGSDLQLLSPSPDGGLDTPADWSINGEIVFFRHGFGPTWDQDGSLWIVDEDGTNVRALPTPGVSPSWWVRWSPDGSRILFASARLSARGAVWTIRPDGTSLTKLFEDPDGGFPVTPAWSPDGRHVVFALDPVADEWTHPINEVFVIRADGTGLATLLGKPDHKREFEWFAAPFVDSVVGTWTRTQSCRELWDGFIAAGLEAETGWINSGFFPEGQAPTTGDLCEGAAGPLEHSHFFTADGRFGSHDEHGQQVDFGTYELDPTSGALRFPAHARELGYDGEIRVAATVTGSSGAFDVFVPPACSGACATAHAWALSAFVSGPWEWSPLE